MSSAPGTRRPEEAQPRSSEEDRNGTPELVAALVAAGAGAVEGILLYGSHLHGARPDRHSALDLVVVVRDYRPFYEGLASAGEIRRSPRVLSALSRILPPNVIAYAPSETAHGIAKCLVVSRGHLARALGPHPPDHFLLGRLVQNVALIWARDSSVENWLDRLIADARGRVITWMGPFVEEPFDAEALGRRMLEVCYRAEFRPEAANRAEVIFGAQSEHFRAAFGPVLEELAAAGSLESTEGGFRLARPATRRERVRWRAHFARSKARVTARWFKHIYTFDNWLPYIVRKVERRTGRPIELTPRERRWPLIFLWPRVIRVLSTRPDTEEPE